MIKEMEIKVIEIEELKNTTIIEIKRQHELKEEQSFKDLELKSLQADQEKQDLLKNHQVQM